MNKVFLFQAYIFFKNQVLHLKGAFLIELPPFLFLQKIGWCHSKKGLESHIGTNIFFL
jgi:hypothetical protein